MLQRPYDYRTMAAKWQAEPAITKDARSNEKI
jgi:hypothetical protein